MKLIDFGLATSINQDAHNLLSFCGTPGFIAPEIAALLSLSDVHNFEARSLSNCDVFSVGAILFYFLTGETPYKGSTYEEITQSNRKAEINCQNPYFQSLDRTTRDLLSELLERDYSKRPRAVEALGHPYFSEETNSEQELVTKRFFTQEPNDESKPLVSVVLVDEQSKIDNINNLFDDSEADMLEVAEEAPFDSPLLEFMARRTVARKDSPFTQCNSSVRA